MSRLISVFALILCLTACYSGTKPTRIGSPAPDFVVQDGNQKVALHDLKGKVVVLNFWATWCPPCVEEMPSLVEMQKKLKGTDVTVLAVSLDVDDAAYKKFIKDHGVDLLTVRDPDQKSNALYGTYKFPETFVIDKNGVLRRKFIGAVDWNDPQIAQYLTTL